MEKREKLIDYLNNMDYKKLLQLYRGCNKYDGSFDFCDVWNLEGLCSCYTDNIQELVECVIYGKVKNTYDMIRFDDCGVLESVNEEELKEDCNYYIDELADWLIDNYNNIDYKYYGLYFLDCDNGSDDD